MKLLTRESRYAVRALTYMARQNAANPDALITVDQVAVDEKIPRVFLRRLLQVLAKNGILASHKGKNGGFSLNRPADQVTMRDIVSIYQGEMDDVDCAVDGRNCGKTGRCSLRHHMVDIHQKLEDELATITIASLL